MRTIKFRGQRNDNGEWVYGWYINKSTDKHQIVTQELTFPVIVKPETVGQFTGLTDKNGKDIYEGDVCDCEYGITGKFKFATIYIENACFYCDDKNPNGNMPLSYWFKHERDIIIIGNIHENQELL